MPLRITALALVGALIGGPAAAGPITATLDGCVTLSDPRLLDAVWYATGTFQAVAFDDGQSGCDSTIAIPVVDIYLFDEDRLADTLTARLNLDRLPICGRRQYDLHYYLEGGLLDPAGLKSLVIDTGRDCPTTCLIDCGEDPHEVSEPAVVALVTASLAWLMRRRRH